MYREMFYFFDNIYVERLVKLKTFFLDSFVVRREESDALNLQLLLI